MNVPIRDHPMVYCMFLLRQFLQKLVQAEGDAADRGAVFHQPATAAGGNRWQLGGKRRQAFWPLQPPGACMVQWREPNHADDGADAGPVAEDERGRWQLRGRPLRHRTQDKLPAPGSPQSADDSFRDAGTDRIPQDLLGQRLRVYRS